MFRSKLSILAVAILLVALLIPKGLTTDGQDSTSDEPVTESTTVDGNAADGGNATNSAKDAGNGSSGASNEIWQKWNETGMGEEDRTWLIKYCPRNLTSSFENFCIIHCWWNNWEGGYCTKDDICVCLWKDLKIDLNSTDEKVLKLADNKDKDKDSVATNSTSDQSSSEDPASSDSSDEPDTTSDSDTTTEEAKK
ncbi:uncharacterized protein LOC123683469 [Harmonia axyridis]|uniref:uncharacterized protein LOC123683469 n=1 Tax=Harmonia axyridis TaxID=115357 RepID=UPI001E2761E3|nr:uncharacterized protein LOC123683469 [Harmonia axyridis]